MSEQTREKLERIKLGYPRIPGNEERMASALLAILKLHEPTRAGTCYHCSVGHSGYDVDYPCMTVEVIEREMGRGER